MRYKKYEKIKEMLLLYHEKIYNNRSNIIQTVRDDICFNTLAMFDKRYKKCYFIDNIIDIYDDDGGFLFIGHHEESYHLSVSFSRNMTSILSDQCVFLIKNNEV